MNLPYIESNSLLRASLGGLIKKRTEVSCMHIVGEFEEVTHKMLITTDLVIFDTKSDVEFGQLRIWLRQYPDLKMMLLSSEKRLLENYLFWKTHEIDAFLTKEVDVNVLIETIISVVQLNKQGLFLPKIIEEQLMPYSELFSPFSIKEKRLLQLLGKGKTTKEAAEILNLSYRTVETHRRRMIERIGCRNIIPVILLALENGDIKIDIHGVLDTGILMNNAS